MNQKYPKCPICQSNELVDFSGRHTYSFLKGCYVKLYYCHACAHKFTVEDGVMGKLIQSYPNEVTGDYDNEI